MYFSVIKVNFTELDRIVGREHGKLNFNPQYRTIVVKRADGNVKDWECMSWQGVGRFHLCNINNLGLQPKFTAMAVHQYSETYGNIRSDNLVLKGYVGNNQEYS